MRLGARLAGVELEVGGERVDLGKVTMPVANVYGKFDHLVPPASSEPLLGLIPSEDKVELCIPTGHIGIFVSSKALKELDAFLVPWLKQRSGPLSGEEASAGKKKGGGGRKKSAKKRGKEG